ncbi:hypothetical protein RND71_013321 [Anisodus tanguticus]|uniref:BHLH domain-containing protein n=1 Tax=Anisodus tanguticus TaxID=243964 RepID=A0AAE1SH94_9SOLA|nr:hypothetical protein RND71_013321 [Anisodus tanguticus]
MEKDYFINGAIPNPPFQFQSTMWQSSDNCLFNPNWDHQFDSTLNSIVSSPYIGTNNTNNSTPLNSPPKLHMPNLGNSLPPPLPWLSTDPGFAQRAACFGSRSFNGRTTPLGLNNNAELPQRSTQPLGNGKLSRVSSSPSLKQAGSPLLIKNSIICTNGSRRANESVSEPSGETVSRKRKKVSRAKTKEDSPMGGEADDSARAKRCKLAEGNNVTENGTVNVEELKDNNEGDETQKQAMENQNPPEPPKDYIHVRARRGQATDSHSLAERVRREKISERMKLLQDLVPGCNKVTGKALMLDQIINYVQSLQRQVEFLSMKLSSVNPSMDFPLSKDICQPNGSLPQPVLPVNKTASALPSFLHNDIPNGALSQCSVDTLDTSLCRSLGMQLSPLDGFAEYLNQFPTMCEDDLQSIVQMGFRKTPTRM